MTKRPAKIIVPRGLEKSPVFQPIEIASRFCSSADFSGTGLPGESPGREPSKAFRNPAPSAAAIPSCHDAAYIPAAQLKFRGKNFLRPTLLYAPFPTCWPIKFFEMSVTPSNGKPAQRKAVFTQTQMTQKCRIFCACGRGACFPKNLYVGRSYQPS